MYQTIEETEPQDELFPYNYASFGYYVLQLSYKNPQGGHNYWNQRNLVKRDLKIGAILRGIEDVLKDIMHKLSISVIYSYIVVMSKPPRLHSKIRF